MKQISELSQDDLNLLQKLGMSDAVIYNIPVKARNEDTVALFAVSNALNKAMTQGLFGKKVMQKSNLFGQTLKLAAETMEIWYYPLTSGMCLFAAYELNSIPGQVEYSLFKKVNDCLEGCIETNSFMLGVEQFPDYINPVTPDMLDRLAEKNSNRYFLTDAVVQTFGSTRLPYVTIDKVVNAIEDKLFCAVKVELDDTDITENRYIVCTREEEEKLLDEGQLDYKIINQDGNLKKVTLWGNLLFEFTTEITYERPISFDRAPQKHIYNALDGASRADSRTETRQD